MAAPSTLIVEDGTGVAAANTYAAAATLQQYAADYGYTLPTDSDAVSVLLRQAMRFLEAREARYQGIRLWAEQVTAWPRAGVRVSGTVLPSAAIPKAVVNAQCQLACDIASGAVLPTTAPTTGNLKKSVVGPVTKEYFAPSVAVAGTAPKYAAVEDYLRPLYARGTGALTVGRA